MYPQLQGPSLKAIELKAAGHTATELKQAQFTAAQLRDAHFTVAEMATAGFTIEELKEANFTAGELRTGFTVEVIEMHALQMMYERCNGANWEGEKNKNWCDPDKDLSEWEGVGVEHGHVVKLSIVSCRTHFKGARLQSAVVREGAKGDRRGARCPWLR